MEKTLKELEEESFNEDDYAAVPPSDIVAYNELRSCADLFRMHQQGILEIQHSSSARLYGREQIRRDSSTR